MQAIIDRLADEKAKAEATIKVNEDAIAQYENTVAALSNENEALRDECEAADAAIAVLQGRAKRGRRRKK